MTVSLRLRLIEDITGEDFTSCVFSRDGLVPQYIKKNMYERDGNTFWCGTNHSNTPYLDKPWEVEAYRVQEGELLVAFTDGWTIEGNQ